MERSLRFENYGQRPFYTDVHSQIKNRSVSLFEPRPEWNHADNAICIIGQSQRYRRIYLDKRPFMNSYDYRRDKDGSQLKYILHAVMPVCSGINLEYYFSRVDQQNLGAGTKLPHNVVGLFAVNNGVDGDLRPGLPSQMIEIHEAVRLLFIIEQSAEIVGSVIRAEAQLYQLVNNEWVHLCIVDPEAGKIMRFRNNAFEPYEPELIELMRLQGEEDLISVIAKEHLVAWSGKET